MQIIKRSNSSSNITIRLYLNDIERDEGEVDTKTREKARRDRCEH